MLGIWSDDHRVCVCIHFVTYYYILLLHIIIL